MNFKLKKEFIFVVLIICCLIPNYVLADTKKIASYGESGWLYFDSIDVTLKNKKSGEKIEGGLTGTMYFTSNKKDVFCIVKERDFVSGKYKSTQQFNKSEKVTRYNKVSDSDVFEVASMSLDVIENDKTYNSKKKKYLAKTTLLNILFNISKYDFIGDGGNHLKSIIKEVHQQVKQKNKNISNFMKASMSITDRSLARIGNTSTYNSKVPIKFSGLMPDLNGNATKYTYSVSGLKSGTVKLCTGPNGSGTCLSNNSITGSGDANYYIQVLNATPGSSFTISFSADVPSYKYPSGVIYYYNGGDKKLSSVQPMFSQVDGKKSISTVQKPISFDIPALPPSGDHVQYNIQIRKVDDLTGEDISGAIFDVRVKETGEKLTLDNPNKGPIFTWSSGLLTVSSTNPDKYLGKHICIKETQSPLGYITNKADESGLCELTFSQGKSAACYEKEKNSTNGDKVEDENCLAEPKCEKGTLSDDENGKKICVYDEEDTQDFVYKCDDESITPDDNHICKKVEPLNSEGETCPEGTTQEDNNCISISQANEYCYDGKTKTTDGKCIIPHKDPAKCFYNSKEVDAKYCENKENYSYWQFDNGNIYVTEVNKKNSVTISKKIATSSKDNPDGDDEVYGASLKICSEAEYNNVKNKADCEAASTIVNEKLEWVSGVAPKEFRGIKTGTYYIIETLPPSGFKTDVTTATQFIIDDDGNVTSGSKETIGEGENAKDIIVVKNTLNKMSISKTDIVTTKELPGAVVSICQTKSDTSKLKEYNDEDDTTEETTDDEKIELSESEKKFLEMDSKTDMLIDKDGNCIPAVLQDGTVATWTSTDKPHDVVGLPAGTYYLVEITAPKGYSTAESIKFIMKNDGTLTDEKGNSLKDNKIIMKDKPIKDVKTGDILLMIFCALGLTGLGIGSYYYFNNKNFKKIFKRFGRVN